MAAQLAEWCEGGWRVCVLVYQLQCRNDPQTAVPYAVCALSRGRTHHLYMKYYVSKMRGQFWFVGS